MPNTLYTTTQELHEVIQAKAEKYGVDIDIRSTRSQRWFENHGYIHLIQQPQIRQILLVFKQVLGVNPEILELNKEISKHISRGYTTSANQIAKSRNLTPPNQIRRLMCQMARLAQPSDRSRT